MENHNNWHSVHMFWAASTRRGDLFLGWHRSQLEYFNEWRKYFGYPPIPGWDPTTSWVEGTVLLSRQHPSITPAPAGGFSTRHDLNTPDLLDPGDPVVTTTEGEYDFVTQNQGRGTNSQFVDAGYILRTETVREILELPPVPAFSRNGIVTVPTWWQPNTGQTENDLWFEAGCPARDMPDPGAPITSTCAVQLKKSFDDYTLRELGESIESGQYATNFQVNYHALGHIAASVDMADPRTSMRDPIFWAWHKHLDKILSDWQAMKGVEAKGTLQLQGNPEFVGNWSRLRVAFSHQIIPELVRAGNVTVNGSPATGVRDVSLTGTGHIFEFSGFSVPPDGKVEVVIRRDVNNNIRTSLVDPRPVPTLIMSTYGNLLMPAVNRITYTKP
jgi:hypothetical protein